MYIGVVFLCMTPLYAKFSIKDYIYFELEFQP